MSDFKLHILGCGSALPTQRHQPTAQILELRGKLFLIDCGEGTQHQIRRQRLSFEAITAIFITHLHGDHIFGLPGLLSSMSMLGRTRGLSIIGPRGSRERLSEAFRHLLCEDLHFELTILEYDDRESQLVWEDRSIEVKSIPLKHRIPTQGYLFRERCSVRHIDKASCDFYGVPLSAYPKLLEGKDWLNEEGELIPSVRLTRPGRKPRTYAVCTDTCYLPTTADFVRGVDLLYHEATFEVQHTERAQETFHSTSHDAARVALDAKVGRLLIGHYSARYKDTEQLLHEARSIFPETLASDEGLTLDIV